MLLFAYGSATLAQPADARRPDQAVDGLVRARPLAIEPLTTIGAAGSGYFEDPYPVRLAPSRPSQMVAISGTTKAIMRCRIPLAPSRCTWTPAQFDVGALADGITAAGDTFTNFQNLNVFQDDQGGWHAVLAIGVKRRGAPAGDHWTVLVHARPASAASPDQVPLQWVADTVLSGSFSERVDGNYDGKYLEDDGKLYLLFVKNFTSRPALRNGIVIQPMVSPTQKEPVPPATLLTTGDRFGPLNSERYDHTAAKLVEAPFITRIDGKYALIYSTGAYRDIDYKVGIAWSDTLLPAPGGRYRKVLQMDNAGVSGRNGSPEVQYLLQSQHADRPNFTPTQVFGPGVASPVQSPAGQWILVFAGYDAADRPTAAAPVANAKHRRPFFVRLRASVPASQTVAKASDAELSTWLMPETR